MAFVLPTLQGDVTILVNHKLGIVSKTTEAQATTETLNDLRGLRCARCALTMKHFVARVR